MNLTQVRNKLAKRCNERDHLVHTVSEEQAALAKAHLHLERCKKAQELLQVVAQDVQSKVHNQIASIVTKCLEAVYQEDSYEFHIEFRRKRGKTEAVILLKKGDLILEHPTREAGGGVVDVCALALRLVCLLLSQPQRRRLIIADEPCKHINGEIYQERVGQLLVKLAEEFKVQFVIASDDEWLKLGKVIDLENLSNGRPRSKS